MRNPINLDKATLVSCLRETNNISRKLDYSKPKAAVLVPIIERNNEFSLLFIRKTEHLRIHAGQISFPGGRFEPIDENLMTTAMRETHEEIGLPASNITIIGKLPCVESISGGGYLITPFVGLIKTPVNLKIDQNEVAETFEIPLQILLEAKFQKKYILLENKRRYFYSINYQNYHVWGATAQIVRDLVIRLKSK